MESPSPSVADRPVDTIVTDRFVLRGLRKSDAAALFATLSDEQSCRYLSHPPFQSEAELWDWLSDPLWPGRTWIAETGEGEVAGRFVAVPTDDPTIEEIGFITTKGFRGKGVARECVSYLIGYLFDEDQKDAVVATVDTENRASISLLENLRFDRRALAQDTETTHAGLRSLIGYELVAATTLPSHA